MTFVLVFVSASMSLVLVLSAATYLRVRQLTFYDSVCAQYRKLQNEMGTLQASIDSLTTKNETYRTRLEDCGEDVTARVVLPFTKKVDPE